MAKIRQKTVVEQVMEQIKELIASGEYLPGDKLPTEHELAERFGIGRSSIREAIKIFNYLGVLTSKAAKGTFLSDRASISAEALSWSILLGKDEQQELIETRGAIELWSIIFLTSQYKKDSKKASIIVEDLQREVDKMRQGIEDLEPHKMIDADYDFHSIIVKSTKNTLFYSIYKTLKAFMYEEISQSHSAYPNTQMIVSEHQSIIDSIKTGEINQSISTFSSHIENIEIRLNIK